MPLKRVPRIRWSWLAFQIDLVHPFFLFMKHTKSSREKDQSIARATHSTAAAELTQGRNDFVPSADEVARKAYFSYVNEGSLPGRDVQHWLKAEADLLAERNLTRVHGFHNKT